MNKLQNYRQKHSFDKLIASSNFDYCKNLKWFLIAPLLIIAVGIVLFCTLGFNLGIDFTGGSTVKIYTNSTALVEEHEVLELNDSFKSQVRDVLGGYNLKIADSGFRNATMTTASDTDTEIPAIEIRYQNSNRDIDGQIRADLQRAFGYEGDYAEYVSEPDFVSASASQETLMNAFIAMLVAIVLILIYVAIRFEITSGLAAILALFHDLLVMTSFVLIFRIEINASFIAALVTILGYSINNTIIIFDRIRENIKSGRLGEKVANKTLANSSIKETMSRSVFTTLTTLITIAMVAIIGVSDIRQFALPIIFGILAGFYSSVFLTPGLWAIAYRPRKRKKRAA